MAVVTGTNDADILVGTPEDDVIDGLGGNDAIDGAAGADVMRGGTGDDIYQLDDAGDQAIELAGEGTDEIRATISHTLAANIENLVLLGSAALAGTGNALNNRITGNGGANVIAGGGGADLFVGGGGDDLYRIEADVTIDGEGGYAFAGVDQVFEAAGEGNDTVETNVGGSLAANVENMILTGSLNIAAFGNALDNRLIGNDGSNLIRGGDGNDLLDGGAGNDNLDGGLGDDTYVVDSDQDILSESPDGGIDTVRSAIDHQLGFGFENLELTGEAFRGDGNQHDNRMIGNGAANSLWGYGGNDLIEAGDGDDQLNGHSGNDVLRGGGGADYLSGGAGDDVLEGGDGNDLFNNDEGGSDTSIGGDGNDGFFFYNRLDIYDVVDGGAGIDTVALRGRNPDVLYFGPANLTNVEVLLFASGQNYTLPGVGGGAFGTFSYRVVLHDANVPAGGLLTVIAGPPGAGIPGLQYDENLQFNGAAESDGAFRIFAGQGQDVLIGGAGNDGFFFETGALGASDRIEGGAGIDSVALRGDYDGVGGFQNAGGAIQLTGTNLTGIEVLTLLSGLDTRFGGTVVAEGFDYDVTLGDANVAADARLDIIASGLAAVESVRFDGSAESDGSFRILAGAGDDLLIGGANADTLYGGLGGDLLDGGAGSDRYLYRATAESTAAARDTIALGDGDLIDLSVIDADGSSAADDAFLFVGAAAFSGAAGELRAVAESGGRWLVEGDADGDGSADLVLLLTSVDPVVAADFIF